MLIKKISHLEHSYHLIPSVNNTAALQGLFSIFLYFSRHPGCVEHIKWLRVPTSEFESHSLWLLHVCFLLTSPLVSCCCCKAKSWAGSKNRGTALPSDSCISEQVLPASCLRSRLCFQHKISTALEKHRATVSRNAGSSSVAGPGQPETVMCWYRSLVFIHKREASGFQCLSDAGEVDGAR